MRKTGSVRNRVGSGSDKHMRLPTAFPDTPRTDTNNRHVLGHLEEEPVSDKLAQRSLLTVSRATAARAGNRKVVRHHASRRRHSEPNKREMEKRTHVFAELIIVCVLDLLKLLSTWSDAGTNGEARTLWKSYLFNCRTKEAKLECLNMRGRMVFVNSFMSLTTKQSPLGPHETTSANDESSSILWVVARERRG